MDNKNIDTRHYVNLGHAVVLRAVRDYFNKKKDKAYKAQIIKDLNSPWCDWLSNGMSVIAAKELQTNPGKIKRRIEKARRDGLIEKEDK